MLEKWKQATQHIFTTNPWAWPPGWPEQPELFCSEYIYPQVYPPSPAPLPAGRARVQPLSASSGQCPRYTSDSDRDCFCSRHICLQVISFAGRAQGIVPGCTQRVVPEAHIGPQATLLLLGAYLPLGAAPKGYAQGTCLLGDVPVRHLPCNWPPSTWGTQGTQAKYTRFTFLRYLRM